MLLLLPCKVQGKLSRDNISLLSQIDRLLEKTSDISMQQEQKLRQLKRQAAEAKTPEEKYWIVRNIFDRYKTYDGDSALVYGNLVNELAMSLSRPDLQNDMMVQSSYTLAAIGMLDRSREVLDKVDYDKLSLKSKVDYLGQKVYLLTHVEQFNRIIPDDGYNPAHVQVVLDSIISIIPADHPEYYYYIAYQALTDPAKARDAIQKVEPHMSQLDYNSQEDAKLAWVVSQLYSLVGDTDGHIKYLALSSIADLNIANREIASLEELSTLLEKEGDLQRANTYIEHCLHCAEQYKNRVRALRVASLQSEISKKYQAQFVEMQQATRRYLIITSILAAILLAATIYIYMQRRRLQASYKKVNAANDEVSTRLKELSDAYAQLAGKNEKLLEMSAELKATNEVLAESDYVKVKCIGSIFAICSQYINKLDDFRRTLTRNLKSGQFDKALRLTESPTLAQNELKEFYAKFDELFLSVYPDFVNDFCALLDPGQPIVLKKEGQLNTELRIFALVRLGITDSVTIANVLHCSVQTVYNKRLKIRNRAIVEKDKFIEIVRTLGKSSRVTDS